MPLATHGESPPCASLPASVLALEAPGVRNSNGDPGPVRECATTVATSADGHRAALLVDDVRCPAPFAVVVDLERGQQAVGVRLARDPDPQNVAADHAC